VGWKRVIENVKKSTMEKIKIYRTSNVFVPGGFPELTYNPRPEKKLEETLKETKDNLCKLVMVTGLTKSGKTVLTNSIYPQYESVWFNGGTFSSEDEFWSDIAEQLEIFSDTTISDNSEKTNQGEFNAGAGAQLVLFKFEGGAKYTHAVKKGKTTVRSRKGNPKTLALQELKRKKKPLIIDDFHYLPRDKQASIVRAVKALIFDGTPVIFIAIPHRRLDAVKVEREMTGRVKTINVPVWEKSELKLIPEIGFPLLNIKTNESIVNRFSNEAIGSPHLMQEFCRELCNLYNVKETTSEEFVIDKIDFKLLFSNIAENTGKVIFDKLVKGPRQRTDRVERKLANGNTTDIYGLVLFALADLKPGIEKIDYEVLRSKIREISAGNPPQAHEVSRVLDKISQIAASDESSTPVIDWEKEERILHVTDPFFAFYLRWGFEN